jgi:hypothetical protein
MVWDVTSNATYIANYPPAFRPFLPILEYFELPPDMSGKTANEDCFPPAWIATHIEQSPNPLFPDPTYRAKMYEFSRTESFGTASLVSFHAFNEFGR